MVVIDHHRQSAIAFDTKAKWESASFLMDESFEQGGDPLHYSTMSETASEFSDPNGPLASNYHLSIHDWEILLRKTLFGDVV